MTDADGRWADRIERLEGRIDLMKREVDELQIEASKERTPWHRSPPVLMPILVSIAAFTFSVWSGLQADARIERQDQHAARAELRGLIQRLQALPKEAFQLDRDYPDDPNARTFLRGQINTENLVLGHQAADLIEQLEGKVSANEYYATAYALAASGQSTRAEELITQGLTVANDALGEAALLRQLADGRFRVADFEGGRDAFRRALTVFDRYPEPNRYLVASTQTFTEAVWASTESFYGHCEEARRHVAEARAHAVALASTDQVKAQAEATATNVEQACGLEP